RDKFRLRFCQQQVEKVFRSVRLKLISVRMIEKPDALLGERLAGLIKNVRSFAACLFAERPAVCDPGAARVLSASRFCLSRDACWIIAKSLIGKMAAHDGKPARLCFLLESIRRHAVGAGRFDILETH